jgi:hypothetical protein
MTCRPDCCFPKCDPEFAALTTMDATTYSRYLSLRTSREREHFAHRHAELIAGEHDDAVPDASDDTATLRAMADFRNDFYATALTSGLAAAQPATSRIYTDAPNPYSEALRAWKENER